jgi:DNA-binding FadR family transcriptional regulator
MNLQPVARQSVSDAVFEQLQAEILGGNLGAGEPLPSERALTEMMGVNRQAVREALKRLDQAGLVEINHGGVTRARNYRESAGLDLLSTLLTKPDGSIDVTVARSIMEMRACIGPDAARLCAGRAVSPIPEHLVAVVEAMDAVADDLPALSALSWRFWELIIDGCDNVAYRLAYYSLRESAAPATDLLPAITGPELRDLDDHHKLAAAIRDGDGATAEATARQILQLGIASMSSLLGALDPTGTPTTARSSSTKSSTTSSTTKSSTTKSSTTKGRTR